MAFLISNVIVHFPENKDTCRARADSQKHPDVCTLWVPLTPSHWIKKLRPSQRKEILYTSQRKFYTQADHSKPQWQKNLLIPNPPPLPQSMMTSVPGHIQHVLKLWAHDRLNLPSCWWLCHGLPVWDGGGCCPSCISNSYHCSWVGQVVAAVPGPRLQGVRTAGFTGHLEGGIGWAGQHARGLESSQPEVGGGRGTGCLGSKLQRHTPLSYLTSIIKYNSRKKYLVMSTWLLQNINP